MQATDVEVFKHSIKKPGCGRDVYAYLRADAELSITCPSQIVVLGDRLLTDIVMANLLGCWAIWLKDGVVKDESLVRSDRIPKNVGG